MVQICLKISLPFTAVGLLVTVSSYAMQTTPLNIQLALVHMAVALTEMVVG